MKKILVTVLVFIGLATICIAKAHATERQEYIGPQHLLVQYLSPAKQIARGLRGVVFDKKAGTFTFKDGRQMMFANDARSITVKAVKYGDLVVIVTNNVGDSHDTAIIYDGELISVDINVPWPYPSAS